MACKGDRGKVARNREENLREWYNKRQILLLQEDEHPH
jgi:hypothetical protein